MKGQIFELPPAKIQIGSQVKIIELAALQLTPGGWCVLVCKTPLGGLDIVETPTAVWYLTHQVEFFDTLTSPTDSVDIQVVNSYLQSNDGLHHFLAAVAKRYEMPMPLVMTLFQKWLAGQTNDIQDQPL
jgi:hypothetical protein